MRQLLVGAILFLAIPAMAGGGELITLKDGTSYVGEVTAVTETHVTVDVDFPKPDTLEIAREDLTDRTLWRVLSHRVADDDGPAWVALGEWAQEQGLYVQALIAYRRAAHDPELEASAKRHIEDVRGAIAEELVERGQVHLLEGRPGSAARYFETVIADYPATAAAVVAKKRLSQAQQELEEAARAAQAALEAGDTDPVLARERKHWDSEVEAIRADLRAARHALPTAPKLSQPVRASRAAEVAVRHLESAWRRVRALDGPFPEGVRKEAMRELRSEVKARLVSAYVAAGYAYLVRPALPQAEEYAIKACELEPSDPEACGLYRKIIQARVASDWNPRRSPARGGSFGG